MAGTSNFPARKQSEIVQIVENVSAVKEIESRFRCIPVKDIRQEMDFSACAVKGVVNKIFQTSQTLRGWSMKVLLKDVDTCNRSVPCDDLTSTRDVISVFLRGKFVEKCKILKVKDLLVITGAQIEKSSRGGHEFNIIANESSDLKIWVIQDPENKTSEIQSGTNQKPLESGPAVAVKKVHNTSSGEDEPPNKRSRLVLQPKPETYTKLADLTVNSVVNVYGVVKFFKSPFKTKGSDFVCTISLVDPSFDSLDQGFKCVLFSKSKESLPLVTSVGDVVRFHRLGVGQYRGELQGKFLPDSAWVVFDINTLDIPQVRSSSKSYSLTDIDKDIIEDLRSWISHKETLNKKFAFTSLNDLSASQNFINLLCQVVSKHYTVNDGVVLTLWDGSLPACQSTLVEPISEQGQITSEQLTQKAAQRSVDVFLYDDHVMGAVRRVCPGDFVCIRNVHLKEVEGTDSSIDKTKSARSRPLVSLEVHKGTICGRGVEILSVTDPVVTTSAMMKFISELEALDAQQEQSAVKESKRMESNDRLTSQSVNCAETQEKKNNVSKERLQNSVATNVESRALQTSCTITEHPCMPFTSLKDIKAFGTVPYKFRCRVKALMYLPSDVRNFVRRSCQSCRYLVPEDSQTKSDGGVKVSASSVLCPHCNQETTLVYLFSFIIEDESSLLHAMVFDKDVATFFPELPSPQDFLHDSHLQETMGQWMLSMTQNPNNSVEFVYQDPRCDKRLWLELCILSYFPQGCEESGKVMYRIFDSTFVADA